MVGHIAGLGGFLSVRFGAGGGGTEVVAIGTAGAGSSTGASRAGESPASRTASACTYSVDCERSSDSFDATVNSIVPRTTVLTSNVPAVRVR